MLYQLPTGKVIEMSIDQYLDLSDEDLEYLIAYNKGDHIEDPFFGASIIRPRMILDDIEEIEKVLDLTEIPIEEKFNFLDDETP